MGDYYVKNYITEKMKHFWHDNRYNNQRTA